MEVIVSTSIVQGFRFEAAHRLPNVPKGHRCSRMHGHSYRVEVKVTGALDPHTGWVIDFYDVEDAFEPVMAALDHQVLNEVPGLENPTAENIAVWIWNALSAVEGLSEIVVHETEYSRAIFTG
jgi:6-pyruvoyltetrahydropterin/6-carboxytetrahydropterin synthase